MKTTDIDAIRWPALATAIVLGVLAAPAHSQAQVGATKAVPIRNLQPFPNRAGAVATFNVNGRIDPKNAFFQSLGSNGRSCGTCHEASQAFSITPPAIRERFERTKGQDPLFASVDGANCANAKRSDRAAHSLLLKHGLIRVANPVPANAQFSISAIHDPYGCALVTDPQSGQLVASVYRRPLPSTNIAFLSTLMWDARETLTPLNDGTTFLANLRSNLTHQVISATMGHAEGTVEPTSAQLAEIVDFELGLFTAQIWDAAAGPLDGPGSGGGPWKLSNQLYYPGINDSLGAEPTGLPFTSLSMSMFTAWGAIPKTADIEMSGVPASLRGMDAQALARYRTAARRDIAAGERLFNTAPLTISAVRGLNDNAALGSPAQIPGTCTTCHDAPNVGHHSLPLPLDIGVGHTGLPGLEPDANISAGLAQLGEPNLPVFEISGCPSPFDAQQPVSFYTTDPGKALISGQCADVNRLKGPVLRGLAARAPYFHNGAAATLMQAVSFYDQRFQMSLTEKERRQLVAFLNSL